MKSDGAIAEPDVEADVDLEAAPAPETDEAPSPTDEAFAQADPDPETAPAFESPACESGAAPAKPDPATAGPVVGAGTASPDKGLEPAAVSDDVVAGTNLDPGLWSGKRRTRRIRLALPVSCKGTGREVYPGRTIDISRGGMLLGLTCAAFRSVVNASSLVELTGCVASLFPHGINAEFLGGSLRARAVVVRVVLDLKASYPLLCGCRFEPILTELECAALGIPIGIDETKADGPKLAEASNDVVAPSVPSIAPDGTLDVPTPAPATPPAAGGRVIAAHLFSTSSQAGAGRFSGHVASIEGKDAVVLLRAPGGETDAVGWAAELGMEVRATLLEDGAMIGDLRGRVRRLDAAGAGQVRVTLLLAKAFHPS